jgi:outer membrane protein assembly factor BamC
MKMRWFLLSSLLALHGCSYIQSLFPDKERDYQFRSEIPDLIIPDDLKAHTLAADKKSLSGAATGASQRPVEKKSVEDSADVSAAKLKASEINQDKEDKPVAAAAANTDAISSLHIDQGKNQAWRLVSRALTRQNVEIVERNIDKGYFYVKYDPDEVKREDNTIWDELDFLFGEDPSHELEYRISLSETSTQNTEVTIQNNEGKTLSNRTATHLLKLIADGITMDAPGNNSQEEGGKNPATQ